MRWLWCEFSEARISPTDPAWYGVGRIREVVTVFAERGVMIAQRQLLSAESLIPL